MTPKEKAKELFNKFHDYSDSNYGTNRFNQNWHGNVLAGERKVRKESAKQCALIAVDEIIEECYNWTGGTGDGWDTKRFDYWDEVKQEIEKL